MLSTLLLIAVGIISVRPQNSPGYFVLSPNVFHVGVDEQVSVSVYGVNQPVTIRLYLQDFPHRRKTFANTQTVISTDRPGNLTVKVRPEDIADQNSYSSRYVYLVARSDDGHLGFHKETKILLSYKNGLVLIQTDKPIYTPKQSVKMRIIPMEFDLMPSRNKVTIVIKNPQGIQVEKWPELSSDTGFISRTLELGDYVLLGNWTIEAWFGHQFSHNTSAQFEVREYVLPKFSVNITTPDYIVQNTARIPLSISARYTYGKPVKGIASLRLSILQFKQEPLLFSTFRTILKDGHNAFNLRTQFLKNLPGNVWFPENGRLQIEAEVTEKATGHKEKAIDTSVHFTSTPYRIKYKNTAKYFKPGLPFVVRVEVNYPNKKPATNVPMKIIVNGTDNNDNKVSLKMIANAKGQGNKDQTSALGEAKFVVDVPRNTKTLDIKVQTDRSDIPVDQNAEALYHASKYSSPTNSFVLIRCNKAEVGQFVTCEAFANKNVNRLNYVVVSSGRIVLQNIIVRKLGILTTIRFQVTSTMSPSARLIVYYIGANKEVVADSTLMDVNDRFPNDISILNGERFQTLPAASLRITVQATPFSRVGFLGVDQSVYLLRNDNRLGRKEVFKTIESLDLGCGVGGGRDNRDVFMEAGVSVISESLVSSGRTNLGCNARGRRQKRSVPGQNLAGCCALGREPSSLGHNCLLRMQSLNDVTYEPPCKIRFFNCCVETHGTKDVAALARSGLDDDDFAGDLSDEEIIEQTQVRSYFPETWIFEEKVTGRDGRASLELTIPDTITTWVVQALAVSNRTGFGLARPFNLVAYKNFFVDVKLPYSVQRGEQFSALVTIFNYEALDIMTKVCILGDERICSPAESTTKGFTKLLQLTVKKHSSETLYFPIVPIEIGTIPIRVVAGSHMGGGDTVVKPLLVKPEGVERRRTQSFVLDPRGDLRDAKQDRESTENNPDPTPFKSGNIFGANKQTNNILLDVPKKAVPGSVGAMVYVAGNLLGQIVTDLITGRSLHGLLRMPSGCGEQTMKGLGPNVYVLQYLTNTKQVTAQTEANAYRYIQSGYHRELTYRRDDKSFSAWGNGTPGSTWLTAFVMRVFCAAQKFAAVQIDPRVVCESIGWITAHQRADGAFPENHWVSHREMIGGLQGDVGMTAFVLTSLLECQCSNLDTSSAVVGATAYLENQLNNINKPYILSLFAYALSLASSPRRFDANEKLARLALYNEGKKTRHWNAGGRALNTETAGYALLTQMALGKQRYGYAGPIVSWLTEQRNTEGGFYSTQDTCVALQALAKYSEKTAGRQLNMKVTLTAEIDPKWKRVYRLTKQNALLQRHEDVSSILGGELFVEAEGSGVSQMQVEVRHNVPTTRDELCKFQLSVKVTEERNGKVVVPLGDQGRSKVNCKKALKRKCKNIKKKEEKKKCRKEKKQCRKAKKAKKPEPPKHEPVDAIMLTVCTRYKGANQTGMSILDVGILTGFEIDNKEIKRLENTSFIDRVEPSDRSVVFYLSEIPNNRRICVSFKLLREFEVGTVQPVPVKVYDYYEPDESCTKFYGPNAGSVLKLGICNESVCRCTQDQCTPCNPGIKNVQTLVRKACYRHEFAFKGRAETIDEEGLWLNIHFKVLEIQKQGNIALNKGDLIELRKQSGCRCPELKLKHTYLVMGQDEGGQRVLDKSAYVKMWDGREKKILDRFHNKMRKGGCGPN